MSDRAITSWVAWRRLSIGGWEGAAVDAEGAVSAIRNVATREVVAVEPGGLPSGEAAGAIRVEEETRPGAPREFFLYDDDAPGALVRTSWAASADDAAEELVPTIFATAPFPPGWGAQPSPLPETRVVLDREGRGYLVGEVDWPATSPVTNARLWSGFTRPEREAIRAIWGWLRRELARAPP